MNNKYTAVKEDDPYDLERPYYIKGSDYEGFTQPEAETIAAILNERGSLTWDQITADPRWLAIQTGA